VDHWAERVWAALGPAPLLGGKATPGPKRTGERCSEHLLGGVGGWMLMWGTHHLEQEERLVWEGSRS
jgi:hypothetical protein